LSKAKKILREKQRKIRKLVEFSEMDRQQLMALFQKIDLKSLRNIAETVSMFSRAFDGRAVDPSDAITRLTNPKKIEERSRFMNYPAVGEQVYCRLVALMEPSARAFREYADLKAECMLSYKGLSRKEWIEGMKAQGLIRDQQSIFLGSQQYTQQPKKRFWQRSRVKPVKEESEVIYD